MTKQIKASYSTAQNYDPFLNGSNYGQQWLATLKHKQAKRVRLIGQSILTIYPLKGTTLLEITSSIREKNEDPAVFIDCPRNLEHLQPKNILYNTAREQLIKGSFSMRHKARILMLTCRSLAHSIIVKKLATSITATLSHASDRRSRALCVYTGLVDPCAYM